MEYTSKIPIQGIQPVPSSVFYTDLDNIDESDKTSFTTDNELELGWNETCEVSPLFFCIQYSRRYYSSIVTKDDINLYLPISLLKIPFP